MKLSGKYKGSIEQFTGELIFTVSELTARTKLYLSECPGVLYCGDIVSKDGRRISRDGYKTSEGNSFCEVIANTVLLSDFNVLPDGDCTYNTGDRAKQIEILRSEYNDAASRKKYCGNGETKLMHGFCMQGKLGDYETVDFQVPTTNGKCDKIDLILRRGDTLYITEAKRFGSNETLLRCILEIQTYYLKLNDGFFAKYAERRNVKKAVMFDESSYAYAQLKENWAKKLLEKFDITVFIMYEHEGEFTVKEY